MTGAGLRARVAERGFEVAYATTGDDLDEALRDPGDLVVAAGGDGTVGRVARRLTGRAVPLVILPLGTANNVARALGIPAAGGPEGLGFDWDRGRRRRLDIGVVQGPWGSHRFVESFGIGLIARAIPILSALKKGRQDAALADELTHDRAALAPLLREARPIALELATDPGRVSGDFLVVEAMNAPLLGPGLRLAHAADPSDGRLDLVTAGDADREPLAEWIAGGHDSPAPVASRGVRSLSFVWRGEPLHIDGRPWAGLDAAWRKTRIADPGDGAEVRVGLEAEGVTVITPGA